MQNSTLSLFYFSCNPTFPGTCVGRTMAEAGKGNKRKNGGSSTHESEQTLVLFYHRRQIITEWTKCKLMLLVEEL